MFDDEGERHQRREWDGFMKFVSPIIGGGILGLAAWGISVETRIVNITSIQIERAGALGKMQEQLDQVDRVANDPAPKPESKVEMEQFNSRLDRLEERFNNFHQFLLQTKPVIVPPSKRGDVPFKLEDKGCRCSLLSSSRLWY